MKQKKRIDSNRGNQYTSARKDAGEQIDPQQNCSSRHVTRQRIAKETNTSEGYVQRAEKYIVVDAVHRHPAIGQVDNVLFESCFIHG